MIKNKSNLIVLLPKNIDGWIISEKHQISTKEKLYEYIDGGAELYLSYNFQNLVNCIYTAPNRVDIFVDIFDMGNSANAYGIFSHSREVIDTSFGQGAQYTSGQLLFWKDKYFISILASPETDISKQAVFNIAEKIDKSIKKEGSVPKIVELIPKEHLIEESIRFFHHYIWLNTYHFISNENILHINKNSDALLAKYEQQEKRILLLLIKYPKKRNARNAYNEFVEKYLNRLPQKNDVKHDQETPCDCQVIGKYFVAVLNAASQAQALTMIEQIKIKLNNK